MLTSSMLGNDNNEIDIELPDEQALQEAAERKAFAETAALRKQRRQQATAAHPIKKKAVQKAREERLERNAALRGLMQSAALKQAVVRLPAAPTELPAGEDPLLRIKEAEEQQQMEKERIRIQQTEEQSAAAAFAAATEEAKPFCRRLMRRTNAQWKKESAAIAYAEQQKTINRRLALVNVCVCGIAAAVIAVGMLVLERPTVSETENRTLATMPDFTWESYFSGEYTAGVAEFYDDTVPMRETFKHATAAIRKYMAWQTGGPVIHGGRPVQGEPEPEITEPVVTTTTTAVSVDPGVEVTTTAATTTTTATSAQEQEEHQGELSNNILISDKRGIMLYGGSYKNGERYASYLNAYKEKLGDSVNIYSMVVPTPCSFYTPEEFQYLIGSEEKNIAHINENLIGVTPVDAYGVLNAHKDEYIYMRTDHHWSALGAFYAAEEFAATARVPFARQDTYEKIVKPGYVGTLYGYSGDITLKNNPEDFFYYVPSAEYTTTYYNTSLGAKRQAPLLLNLDRLSPVSWYMVYLGGDERVTHVETAVNNDRTLVIMKDSYGNALVPWLTSSFEDIYVIDLRYFKPNVISYMQEIGATDLLFAMNTFSATGGNAKHINTLMNQ